jgi:PTS system ascorbate-specific IIA component
VSIALFFITHEGIASSLLKTGEAIVQKPHSNLSYIEVPMDAAIDKTVNSIENKLKQLTIDNGIFFITDIYGSTPSNIAQQLADKYKTHMITGVNLPMIIRLLNYRDEPGETLLHKALEGAYQGIQNITATRHQSTL